MYRSLEYLEEGYYNCRNGIPELVEKIRKEKDNINRKYNKLRKTKSGEYVDMRKQKYERDLEFHGEVEEEVVYEAIENAVDRKKIKVYKQIVHDDRNTVLGVVKCYDENNNFKFFFKFSQKQMWEFKDAICSLFLKLVPWTGEERTNFDTNVKLFIALLKEPEYMISVEHLTSMGVKNNSAYRCLEAQVKKGNLVPCGKVGKRKFYTCVIPRHELAEMFKPYEEESE